MRGFSLAIAALAFTGSAHAADMPLPVKAPPPPPVVLLPTWTGCYIGANAGAAFEHTDFRRVGQVNGAPMNNNFGSQSHSSAAAGGQVGCDYQFNNFVFGAQGLIDGTGLKGTNRIPVAVANANAFAINHKTDWYSTVTGRVGYTVIPSVLVYAKGGAAFTEDRLAVLGVTNLVTETAKTGRVGWTAGGGVEWMFHPNVSAFLEYQHLDFGGKNVAFRNAPGVAGAADIIRTNQRIDTVMAGVNYHFRPGTWAWAW
jgi:outer membrane immunogenic protein